MARQQSVLGAELVENFKLLLRYHPNEECASHVNEHVLSVTDKKTFQSLMIFILDILNEDWRSEISSLLVTKQDERQFYNKLSEHLKTLRKEFPEIGLPLLTPSSLVCFHGERARENLLKITTALMFFLMKKHNYQDEGENDQDGVMEYTAICEECNILSKEIRLRRKESNNVVSHEEEVLQLIVSAGYWSEETKKKLLNIKNTNIISVMQKKKKSSSDELKSLKAELIPYFNHVVHNYKQEECVCPQELNLSEDKIFRIRELIWEANKNRICVDIMYLKLIGAIKTLKVNTAKSVDPDIALDEHIPSALIERLEKLVSVDQDEDISQNVDALLGTSPFTINITSPPGDTSLNFTPVSHGVFKMKKPSVRMDLESVADLIMPVKVGVSPVRPMSGHMIVSNRFEKPKSNETIMTIVQKLNSRETPNKFGKQTFSFSDLRTSLQYPSRPITAGTSFSKIEKFTPARKVQMPVLSQTTGRRQTMGFVKPANCVIRRQLNTVTPAPKTQTFSQCSEKKPKSVSDKVDQDKLIDMLVQQMVEDQTNESFSSVGNLDNLDSSLSGVEPIAFPLAENDSKTELKIDESTQLVTHLDQVSPVFEESILSEIIEDGNELSILVENIVNDECTTTEDPEDEFDVSLNDKEMSKVFESQQKFQRTPELPKKCDGSSLDLLIQRVNAIKKARQQKQ